MPTPEGAEPARNPQAPSSDTKLQNIIRRNVADVRDRIARAARAAGRDPNEIQLVAISKTFPIAHVRAAAAVGLTDFGENRVQEALQKVSQSTQPQIRWHLVGHLQSNKARKAATAFAWIHSVDSVSILQRLDRAAAEQSATPSLLVQVDLADEATKYGASIDKTRHILDAASTCQAAKVRGLMLMPPWFEDPEVVRPYFRRLRELRDELTGAGVKAHMLRELSMGMSRDFETAIEEGATMVRIGTALFGRRTPAVPTGAA